MIKRILTLFVLTLAIHSYAQQPLSISWQKTIGGEVSDLVTRMSSTKDGGAIVCGKSASTKVVGTEKEDTVRGGNDFWIVKLSANGNIQWQKTIGGHNDDVPSSIVQIKDGYVIAGYSGSNIGGEKTDNCRDTGDLNNFDLDSWVMKLDNNGNILWQKTIGGTSVDGISFLSLISNALLGVPTGNETIVNPTEDNGYIVGTSSSSIATYEKAQNYKGSEPYLTARGINLWLSDYWIIKLNSAGAIQWQKTIGGELSEQLCAIQQTSDNGYIVGGSSSSNISFEKTEANKGGGYITRDSMILMDTTADILLPMNAMDYWILKLNDTGHIVWQKTIGGDKADYLTTIIPSADGGYIMGGSSNSSISGNKADTSRGNFDYWIVKIDNTGAIEWQRTLGGSENDLLTSIHPAPTGGYLLLGTSFSGVSGDKTSVLNGISDYWMVQLSAGGNIEWQQAIGGANELFPELSADAIPYADGSVLVAGSTDASSSGDKADVTRGDMDYWVLKLCGAKADTSITVNNHTLHANATGVTYQWINCNTKQPIAGATQATFAPVTDGSYAVVIAGTCGVDTSMCYTTGFTSVASAQYAGGINIYPNPAGATIFIDMHDDITAHSISLINVAGQEIYRGVFASNHSEIDVTNYPAGTYFIKLQTNNGYRVSKIELLH